MSLVDSTGYGLLSGDDAAKKKLGVFVHHCGLIVVSPGAALTVVKKGAPSLLSWLADYPASLHELVSSHLDGGDVSGMPVRVSFVPLRESLGSDRDDAAYADLCRYRSELDVIESSRTIRSYADEFPGLYSNRSDRFHMDSSVARDCILKIVGDARAEMVGRFGPEPFLINVVAGWNAKGGAKYRELFAVMLLSHVESFGDCMFAAKLLSRRPFAELLGYGWPGCQLRSLQSPSLPWLPAKLYQTHISDDTEAPRENMLRFAAEFERVFYDDAGCQARRCSKTKHTHTSCVIVFTSSNQKCIFHFGIVIFRCR